MKVGRDGMEVIKAGGKRWCEEEHGEGEVVKKKGRRKGRRRMAIREEDGSTQESRR